MFFNSCHHRAGFWCYNWMLGNSMETFACQSGEDLTNIAYLFPASYSYYSTYQICHFGSKWGRKCKWWPYGGYHLRWIYRWWARSTLRSWIQQYTKKVYRKAAKTRYVKTLMFYISKAGSIRSRITLRRLCSIWKFLRKLLFLQCLHGSKCLSPNSWEVLLYPLSCFCCGAQLVVLSSPVNEKLFQKALINYIQFYRELHRW